MPFLPPNQQRQSTEGTQSTEGIEVIMMMIMVERNDVERKRD